ncbi:Caspase 8, apoptosis- cysteine peptidase, like 2 [Desmophyllum pertusum]|uniref:Caspase 8, apoptosis- cysteine peptidase, like 2 n=1 Tax=Desmophyllum pertusum TaxID=174260 RepID=A0A9X0CU92_9CNID|nr:Caspase 8, apoptosis- cysteine peptidase, like 2 [Desmophyllum pertusum]
MAHGGSPVVVRGGVILNRFRAFLERLSLEIEQDQLEGLKFLLQENIPLGILEKCLTARQLFSRMIQTSLLGEGNLDNLEKLFTDIQRSDLAERVKVFKQSSMEVECELPVMEIACFAIGAQRTDLNVKIAEDRLVLSMCAALHIDPSEIRLVGSEEVGDNWFNITFEIPKRKQVLDTLRWAAIQKEPWLTLCGVQSSDD